MADFSRTKHRYRRYHSRARVGSTRWFGRYRILVILGWVAALVAAGWVVRMRSDHLANPVVSNAKAWSEAPDSMSSPGQMAPIRLPADDAPHENATEWWYYNGHLQTESGEQYSFHMTTFLLQGVLSHTAFHCSLLDHKMGKQYIEQARTEGNPSYDTRDGFDFTFGKWQMKGSGANASAGMEGKDFALDLRFRDWGMPVLHQMPTTPVPGLLDFGAAGKSYYYSRPRMKAEGTLDVGGVSKVVRGEVWFDHQWGDFDVSRLRWNLFALQLADGADLMAYELFDREGTQVMRMGTYTKGGQVTAFGASDFKATAQGTWKSESNDDVYPMDWTITLPAKDVHVKLEPVIRHSHFNALATTQNVYWKGPVIVIGSPMGKGFVEMSGYEPLEVSTR